MSHKKFRICKCLNSPTSPELHKWITTFSHFKLTITYETLLANNKTDNPPSGAGSRNLGGKVKKGTFNSFLQVL